MECAGEVMSAVSRVRKQAWLASVNAQMRCSQEQKLHVHLETAKGVEWKEASGS